MISYFTAFFEKFPFLANTPPYLALALAILCLAVFAILINIITKYLIVAAIHKVIASSSSARDDILARRKVFSRLSHVAPALAIYAFGPQFLDGYPVIADRIATFSLIYLTIICVLFVDGLMTAGEEIYSTYKISRTFPLKSFVQVATLIVYFLGFVAILSLIMGESPLTFFAGFGAFTAVLMLVFKDPILGFVAGIQLSANKMVSVGDWIEMPRYGVDGDVIEIALTTVKIRNFDKTITTIPTQSMINDSFKNWRGMQETGGRRIKRSVFIDVSSIKFCDAGMIKRFSKIQFIADYIEEKDKELAAFNADLGTDTSLVNGRRMTNVGTFRAYTEAYLRAHPNISKDLTLLVRQLQPTEHGLPIEIYVFTNVTGWLQYEAIMADIFDHILASAREFDLRIYQNPTGGDFGKLAR
ncbi:MAG: mechanosensitive ion channel protein MscS [Alphaproteobacteria bacterium]|nr:MAG: mechanosensitive ion channel protein MscS [Alphaproteobacteria bacterium]